MTCVRYLESLAVSMAAIRGFSLANISNIRIAFSTFDSRVASARYKIYKDRFPFLSTEKLSHVHLQS